MWTTSETTRIRKVSCLERSHWRSRHSLSLSFGGEHRIYSLSGSMKRSALSDCLAQVGLPCISDHPLSPRWTLDRCGSWSRWCVQWWRSWCRTVPHSGGSPHEVWRQPRLPPSSTWRSLLWNEWKCITQDYRPCTVRVYKANPRGDLVPKRLTLTDTIAFMGHTSPNLSIYFHVCIEECWKLSHVILHMLECLPFFTFHKWPQ